MSNYLLLIVCHNSCKSIFSLSQICSISTDVHTVDDIPKTMADRMRGDSNYRDECEALLNEDSFLDSATNACTSPKQKLISAPLWIVSLILLKFIFYALSAVAFLNHFLCRASQWLNIQLEFQSNGNVFLETLFLALATINKLMICLTALIGFTLNTFRAAVLRINRKFLK